VLVSCPERPVAQHTSCTTCKLQQVSRSERRFHTRRRCSLVSLMRLPLGRHSTSVCASVQLRFESQLPLTANTFNSNVLWAVDVCILHALVYISVLFNCDLPTHPPQAQAAHLHTCSHLLVLVQYFTP
jgi:hypothetical protein